jgi:aryl-alcohol dehydrogenase-like predicted oxidoreductase
VGHGERDKPIIDAVEAVAGRHSVSMAQVAFAWVLANPTVDAPIVGGTSPTHLADAAAALEVNLDEAGRAALEEAYTPRQPTGLETPRRLNGPLFARRGRPGFRLITAPTK